MYREARSSVPGAVVWTSVAAAGAAPTRILPDGCMDLIWFDDALLVAGPDTGAYLADGPAVERTTVGMRFGPGLGPALLGIPASELRDQRVPLAALWPGREVRRLEERIGQAGQRGAALEAIAADRMRRPSGTAAGGPGDPVTGWIVERLQAGQAVAEIADAVGLSDRHLHRRSLAAFGYGPKTLARVLRFNRALGLARSGLPFADVAATAGYADQAHLSREVKGLAGVPLSRLTR